MSFVQQMQDDLAAARSAAAGYDNAGALAITARYVGPMSRNKDFLHLHVALLQGSNAPEEAEIYIDRLLALDPGNPDVVTRQANGLRCSGRHRQAHEVVVAARAQHPDHVGLLGKDLCLTRTLVGPEAAFSLLYAENRRQVAGRDIRAAVEEFRQIVLSLEEPELIQRLDPDNLLGFSGIAAEGQYSLRSIYERFESLGSNCDFGQVQRLRGAEPLSFLRWTTVDPASLTRMLASDLARLDDPGIYQIVGNEIQEFFLKETEYGTISHTGVNLGDIDREQLHARLVRRQVFLRRKFLDELRKGEKIFLYKAAASLDDGEMQALEDQLVRLGATKILFTVTTSDPREIATVRQASPKRLTGYLSTRPFADKLDEWDKVVVAAYDRFC